MEIKSSKGIKNGYKYERVFINGEQMGFNSASNVITDTSGATFYGIFSCGEVEFVKGGVHKTFKFDRADKFATPEYVEALKRRIAEVREWVNGLDYEHSISFSVQDP